MYCNATIWISIKMPPVHSTLKIHVTWCPLIRWPGYNETQLQRGIQGYAQGKKVNFTTDQQETKATDWGQQGLEAINLDYNQILIKFTNWGRTRGTPNLYLYISQKCTTAKFQIKQYVPLVSRHTFSLQLLLGSALFLLEIYSVSHQTYPPT